MDPQLRVLTFLGKIIGTVPPEFSCFGHLSHGKKRIFGVAYCIVVLLLNLTIWADYMKHTEYIYIGRQDTIVAVATRLMNVTTWITQIANQVLLRLNCLYFAPEFIRLLENLSLLKFRVALINETVKKELCDGRRRLWCFRALGAFCCLSLGITCACVTWIFLRDVKDLRRKSWIPWLMGSTIIDAVPDIYLCCVISFVIMQFILPGVALLNAYISIGNALGNYWISRTKSAVSSAFLGETFQILTESMDLFNTVCGLNLFILITTYTIQITWVVYYLYMEGGGPASCLMLDVLLIFANISCFGEQYLNKIRSTKNKVRSSMALSQANVNYNDDDETRTRELTKWFLNWNANLSAMGFYPVNHSLIPTVVSATATLVIFVFQLRQSGA